MRTSKIILVAFLYLIVSLDKPLCSLVWYIICPEGLIFWMISCRVTRSVWVRIVLLVGVSSSWRKAFPLRNWLS